MNKSVKYSSEVQERAVRLVFEHQGEHKSQWVAIGSIACKIGCTPETLRKWVREIWASVRACPARSGSKAVWGNWTGR